MVLTVRLRCSTAALSPALCVPSPVPEDAKVGGGLPHRTLWGTDGERGPAMGFSPLGFPRASGQCGTSEGCGEAHLIH